MGRSRKIRLSRSGNERHLYRILTDYFKYYHLARPRLSLDRNSRAFSVTLFVASFRLTCARSGGRIVGGGFWEGQVSCLETPVARGYKNDRRVNVAPSAAWRQGQSPAGNHRRSHEGLSALEQWSPVTLCLGTSTVLAAGPAAPDSAATDAGLIVFSSNRSGPWRIWSVRPDGSALRELTKAGPEEHDVDPVFSPDGKSILFTSTRGGAAGIWRMSLDGRKPQRICDGDQAEWSPDGKQIVFRRQEQIFVRDLTDGPGEPHQPRRLAALLRPGLEPGRQADRLCLPLGRRQRPVPCGRRGRQADDGLRQAGGLRAALVARRHTARLRNRDQHLHDRSRRQEEPAR